MFLIKPQTARALHTSRACAHKYVYTNMCLRVYVYVREETRVASRSEASRNASEERGRYIDLDPRVCLFICIYSSRIDSRRKFNSPVKILDTENYNWLVNLY